MIGRESSYVDYMKAAPGFSVWQNFVPTKANFYAIGQIFIVANGQIMKQNQAIWSHWLLSIFRTLRPHVLYLISFEFLNAKILRPHGSTQKRRQRSQTDLRPLT